jgi:hypothetical protein
VAKRVGEQAARATPQFISSTRTSGGSSAAAAAAQPQRHVAVSRRIEKSHALAPALVMEAKRDELLGDKGERRGLTALTSRGGGSG